MFFSNASDGILYRIDTIRHEGKLWLVPEWFDNPKAGWRKPVRIVCMNGLPHQETPGGPTDFVLNAGIPKSVFDDPAQPQSESGYLVIERPDIRFPAVGG